ncbi:MAG: geranylgeranylglyceryl/heptaprenylglyceryl phosphate synthase [Candidatus Thermoplasmatota archaeon]|jgi:phosphoglycerol geranylgeranyltransferase|nr:geranylgeranylglyceryl/heptaprenylglyceryl phosphate synthase [Candidatus Thermoplasmatota archaeon]
MKSVARQIEESLARGPIHFTLIDPDKTRGPHAGEVAREAEKMGSFGILLGGSTGITPELMGAAARSVHKESSLPVIIFPQGPESLTPDADAILFMSLLNSRNVQHVIRLQALASLYVKKLGLETLPVGYLIVAPGMKVGEVGEADCIERSDLLGAKGYALAAQFLGMKLLYLEAGSGAPAPVPGEMIRELKRTVSVPLLIGGGIRTAADAAGVLEAGADGIITGSIAEEDGHRALAPIVEEVRRRRAG